MPKKIKIAHVYYFENGTIAVFDTDGNQVPELQGKNTKELRMKIKKKCTPNTEIHK